MPVCQYNDCGRSGAVWSVASAASSASSSARSDVIPNCRNVQVSVASETTMAASGSAETIAGMLGVGTKSIADEEAPQHLRFIAPFAGFDNPTSNDKTRQVVGWEPVRPGWVEDVQTGHYFA